MPRKWRCSCTKSQRVTKQEITLTILSSKSVLCFLWRFELGRVSSGWITESLWNHTITDHKEGEQMEDRRNVGESSCNFGEGTDQRVQSLMFTMMMIILSSMNAVTYNKIQIARGPKLFSLCSGLRFEL